MQHISPARLKEQLDAGHAVYLVDVREAHEHAAFNIGGELAPLSELFDHISKIPADRPVIVYCKMGIRSQLAIQRIHDKFGFTNLINLQGGIEAWKKEMNGS
jgi:rhodanese-related sulfurtransferase